MVENGPETGGRMEKESVAELSALAKARRTENPTESWDKSVNAVLYKAGYVGEEIPRLMQEILQYEEEKFKDKIAEIASRGVSTESNPDIKPWSSGIRRSDIPPGTGYQDLAAGD